MMATELTSNWRSIEWEKIINLYESVNWHAYLEKPDSLRTAFENSTFINLMIKEGELCGLVRCLSDDVSIHYLQDILIHPSFQRQGIGRALFNSALERFEHVRAHMLLTDDEEKQISFYESLGYSRIASLKKVPLNAFVKMKDVSLS